MNELHLNTTAFTPPTTATSSGRSRKKSAGIPQVTRRLLRRVDADTVRVAVDIHSDRAGVVVTAQSSHDGEGWVPVTGDRLEEGLSAILGREALLERTAARYGLSADMLLSSLAESVVDLTDDSAGVPAAELDVLHAAGISLGGSPHDPSGVGQVAVGLARFRQFREESLTVAQAANELSVSPGRVRQLVTSGSVITMVGDDGSHLLPAWQFVGGRLLPGLDRIAEATAGLHPLTVAGFMTRPNADLDVEGEPVSPNQWLIAGGDVQTVADLAAGLRLAA